MSGVRIKDSESVRNCYRTFVHFR